MGYFVWRLWLSEFGFTGSEFHLELFVVLTGSGIFFKFVLILNHPLLVLSKLRIQITRPTIFWLFMEAACVHYPLKFDTLSLNNGVKPFRSVTDPLFFKNHTKNSLSKSQKSFHPFEPQIISVRTQITHSNSLKSSNIPCMHVEVINQPNTNIYPLKPLIPAHNKSANLHWFSLQSRFLIIHPMLCILSHIKPDSFL